ACFSKIRFQNHLTKNRRCLMSRRFFLLVLSIAMTATVALAPAPAAATTAPCTLATFADLNLPETTITLVESLPVGPYPSHVDNITLPICRVRGDIAPP